jgi:hypothetical protein
VRWLIVNGDDFGASRGINRDILEAHRNELAGARRARGAVRAARCGDRRLHRDGERVI